MIDGCSTRPAGLISDGYLPPTLIRWLPVDSNLIERLLRPVANSGRKSRYRGGFRRTAFEIADHQVTARYGRSGAVGSGKCASAQLAPGGTHTHPINARFVLSVGATESSWQLAIPLFSGGDARRSAISVRGRGPNPLEVQARRGVAPSRRLLMSEQTRTSTHPRSSAFRAIKPVAYPGFVASTKVVSERPA